VKQYVGGKFPLEAVDAKIDEISKLGGTPLVVAGMARTAKTPRRSMA
jgi:high-affinity K+ transport system ATPase subunit B